MSTKKKFHTSVRRMIVSVKDDFSIIADNPPVAVQKILEQIAKEYQGTVKIFR